jgi:hypothetical protein
MPIELFDDEKLREQRRAILLAANPEYEFEEWKSTIITDVTKDVPVSDDDDDGDDDD